MGDSSEAKRVANRLQARSLTLPYLEQELALDLGLSRRDVLKIAGYGSLAAFLAACGSTSASSSGITATGGSMSLGSYASDPGSKAGVQAIADAFKAANGGTKVNINTVDHGTFQNQITSYLQGTPQDVFTWFSGHRMRFFADKGLATPIDDVWDAVKGNYTPGFKGLTWEQGADQLLRKQAGMYLLGLFVGDEFKASGSQADLDQLDFFAFPDLGTSYDAEKALDAPIDVYMVTKKSPTLSADTGQAKAFLEFMSKGSSQITYWKASPGAIPTANDADQSQYPALTKKAAQIVSNAKRITQFFDRDSRPDFSGPNSMQGFLLKYLSNPKQDTGSLQGQMQSFWDSLQPE